MEKLVPGRSGEVRAPTEPELRRPRSWRSRSSTSRRRSTPGRPPTRPRTSLWGTGPGSGRSVRFAARRSPHLTSARVSLCPPSCSHVTRPTEATEVRAVVQRVAWARVAVSGEVVGSLAEPGFVVLLGVRNGDGDKEAAALASKFWTLRIMADDEGRMNRSLSESGGGLLVISQFTLYGDAARGRRPSLLERGPGRGGGASRAEVRGVSPRPWAAGRDGEVRRPHDRRAGQRRPRHAHLGHSPLSRAIWKARAMRYVILGAGAIGGTMGGRLFESGHDVVLVARGAHQAAIAGRGLELRDPDRAVTFPSGRSRARPRSASKKATSRCSLLRPNKARRSSVSLRSCPALHARCLCAERGRERKTGIAPVLERAGDAGVLLRPPISSPGWSRYPSPP